MRLNIRKINNYSYYSIIKDYTNLDGKRSTKIFEKLGNQKQVEERFGKIDMDLCQVFRHFFLKDKPYLNLFQFLHQFRDPVIYLVN